MDFKDRLLALRNELNIKTHEEMANKLDITRSLYSMLERGSRTPSKNVLRKLQLLTNKPEEYWLYGIDSEKEYLEKREEFKCVKDATETLKQIDSASGPNDPKHIKVVNGQVEYSDVALQILIAALKADTLHLSKKQDK